MNAFNQIYISIYQSTRSLIMKWYTLVLLSVVLCSGCQTYKSFLSNQHQVLQRVAASSYPGQQKLDSLVTVSLAVMDQALKPINPVKGGKMLDAFIQKNGATMELIFNQATSDFESRDLVGQGLFIAALVRKDHYKKFRELYPKVEKKYKQVRTAGKFIGFFSKGIFKKVLQ